MMQLSNSEYYTYQYYTWEYRGRGWFLAEQPVQLEPPFIPFFRHTPKPAFIDDGKRHTIVRSILEAFKGKKTNPTIEADVLDYEELEPFAFETETILKAIQIKVSKERKITPEKMKALIVMLSQSYVAISFEIIGNAKEIIIQFVADERDIHTIATYTKAYFPDCTVLYADETIDTILKNGIQTLVIDFGLKEEFVRPLQIPRNFSIDPLTALFGALEHIGGQGQGGIQILFQGVVNCWAESMMRSVTLPDGTSFFADDPNAPKMAIEKIQSPLFAVTIRAFAQGEQQTDALKMLERISYAILNGSKSATNQLIPLPTQIYDFETRVNDIYLRESHRLGMLLNADELTTLLHFPSESIVSKKLFSALRKTKEVPAIAKGKAFILGENYHNGITTKVSFGIEDRLKHTHIIGATGTGKSTLIANLILQDIEKGIGVVLFDPHGDLVDDIIARIPEHRINDVVLVDPADTEYPVGLNILQAYSDIEKEVLSSDLVAAFRRYATSWGDQMNAVFGNAILAILENDKGGSLNDLRRFLIEREFRNEYLKGVADPSVLYYWQKEYPLLKTNSIGPILTRLDTFLRPKSIRNMVVQKTGLDFEALLNGNKIILLKLSQGLIGVENSFLLGSLILSKIHQAVFRRQQQSSRNPIFIYLDEFQNFITPSIKEMLSGIRKYNVGLTLSHQDLQQLQREDGELLNSVLGNINTRIVFRLGEPDAKKLQDGFSGFDFTDLQNLGRGEAVIRIEQPQFDCSLDTIVLETIREEQDELNRAAVLNHTREHYTAPREEVERLLAETLNLDITKDEKKPEILIEKKPYPKPVENRPDKQIEKQTEQPLPIYQQPAPVEIPKEQKVQKTDKDLSTHRYLQTLVKKMAEARGYTAVLEMQLSDGGGNVDVLLSREGKTIAVEICVTTDPDWEMHNIEKCIAAKYDTVVSLSGDPRQLEKIKKKCKEGILDFENKPIQFFTPDALFAFLDTTVIAADPQEQIIKGYRVNVTYDSITQEEMDRKRAAVAKVVMNSLRKRKK
jgi:hypothetical protein